MAEGPRVFRTTYATPVHVTTHAECMIMPLWRRGNDTLQIAKALGLPEYEIANRLSRLREIHKQMRGGG